MLPGAALAIYFLFCVLVGLVGSQRRLGFFGTFLVSLFVTPIIVMLVLIFTAPTRETQ